MTPVKPPVDGWHWKEWWAELAGTAVLLFAIGTARYRAIRGGPPWSDQAVTIAIIGAAAGLAVLGVSSARSADAPAPTSIPPSP